MEHFNPKTVTIGNQVWMAENLAITDGDNGIHYNENNKEVYYTWDAAMRVAKSIPGWHLPSTLEWNEAAWACGATKKPFRDGSNISLNDYIDAKALKDKLDVKLAGSYNGSFYNVDSYASFWTSTEGSSTSAYNRQFNTGTSMVSYNYDKNLEYSVRLVKDSENSTEALKAQINNLEDGKKAWEDVATANASMLSAYEQECKAYKNRIKELENETKHMESLERTNKILEEQNLAYKKLLETKDAEIAEIRRSTEFYKNYYLEDKEVHRPAMLEEMRKLKAKIKEMEG